MKMKSDEDAPCDICRSKESEASNEMVFCDLCDVCVHQACYGVTEIPKDSWFCKPCEENIRPKCIFCPNKKGAKKKTRNGNWAHVSCALWIPEVSFGDPDNMEDIVNVEKIPKSRWNLTCSLCHVRGGACIQCYVKKCKIAYHVTCAFESNLHMEMDELDNEENDQEIKFESFCMTHTSLHASGQNPHKSTGSSKKQKTVQDENKVVTKPLQNKAPLEEENRPSTSHDTNTPVASTTEKTIEENGNKFQNGVDSSKIDSLLFTEQDIINVAAFSKATARKSFALPPKKAYVLSQVLPRPKAKKVRNSKRPLSDKSKQDSVQNGPSNPKKPRSKQSPTKRTKAVIHPNSPTTQGKQASSTTLVTTSEPSDSDFDIRQLFPSPNKQTIAMDMPSTSKEQQLLPSSVQPAHTPGHIEQPLSRVAMGIQDTSAIMPKSDNFDDFSRYMISLLRTLPFKKALRVQKKIISLVLQEHDLSSEEEFVSSCSSDE